MRPERSGPKAARPERCLISFDLSRPFLASPCARIERPVSAHPPPVAVVFQDLRDPLLEQLYTRAKTDGEAPTGELWPMLHSRRSNRLLLQLLLDKVLISISDEIEHDGMRRAVIFSVFTATVEVGVLKHPLSPPR